MCVSEPYPLDDGLGCPFCNQEWEVGLTVGGRGICPAVCCAAVSQGRDIALSLSNPEAWPCSRLATSEAPDAMEEWDVPQMKKEVESLKYQLAFKREMSSKTIPELLKWIEDGIPKDPFLNPDLMKNNPWVEKGKCAIL